jgi:hypothetical protein
MTRAEAIIEARRKYQAREFDRKIVKRTPKNLLSDIAELECGHTEATSGFDLKDKSSPCLKYIDRWIEENSRE